MQSLNNSTQSKVSNFIMPCASQFQRAPRVFGGGLADLRPSHCVDLATYFCHFSDGAFPEQRQTEGARQRTRNCSRSLCTFSVEHRRARLATYARFEMRSYAFPTWKCFQTLAIPILPPVSGIPPVAARGLRLQCC